MYLKRRGEKLYFNLSADRIGFPAGESADSVKGEIIFRGKVGKNIEERKDKNDKPGVKIDARGEMTLSVHNGKPDLSCRVEELALYVPAADHPNQ